MLEQQRDNHLLATVLDETGLFGGFNDRDTAGKRRLSCATPRKTIKQLDQVWGG